MVYFPVICMSVGSIWFWKISGLKGQGASSKERFKHSHDLPLASGTFLSCHEDTSGVASVPKRMGMHTENLSTAQSLGPNPSKPIQVTVELQTSKAKIKICCCLSLRFWEYLLWNKNWSHFPGKPFSNPTYWMNRSTLEALRLGKVT